MQVKGHGDTSDTRGAGCKLPVRGAESVKF